MIREFLALIAATCVGDSYCSNVRGLMRGVLPLPPLPPPQYHDPDEAQENWDQEVIAIANAEKRTLQTIIAMGLGLEEAEKTWMVAAKKQLIYEHNHLAQLVLKHSLRPARAEERLRDDTNAAKEAHKRVHTAIAKKLADAAASSLQLNHAVHKQHEQQHDSHRDKQDKRSVLRHTAQNIRPKPAHKVPPKCLLDCPGVTGVSSMPSLWCFAYAVTHPSGSFAPDDDLATNHDHHLHRCVVDCSSSVVQALRKYASDCGQVDKRIGEFY